LEDNRVKPDRALGDPRKKNFEYYSDLLEINKKSNHMKKFYDPSKMRSTSLNVKKTKLSSGFRQTLDADDEDELKDKAAKREAMRLAKEEMKDPKFINKLRNRRNTILMLKEANIDIKSDSGMSS
jgi:hypothetical protein